MRDGRLGYIEKRVGSQKPGTRMAMRSISRVGRLSKGRSAIGSGVDRAYLRDMSGVNWAIAWTREELQGRDSQQTGAAASLV